MPTDPQSLPRLECVHASVFAAGTLATLLGIVSSNPPLLAFGGACFATSGVLIWAGVRVTLRGPLGDALRLALGRRRVATLRLRAVFWVVLGLALMLLAGRARSVTDDGPLSPRIAAPSS